MRPIDADALVNDLYNDIPIRAFGSCKRIGEMIKYIEKRPTIDAVPVVRCKDCKYRAENGRCYTENGIIWGAFVGEDWFCADGERREEE